MGIYSINISHKTAPVEIRELVSLSRNEKIDFLTHVKELTCISECVLITTCNRTELYLVGSEEAVTFSFKLLTDIKQVDYTTITKYILRYEEVNAIKHLFKVTSGLDSMVIGEDEILGQVKEDFALAKEVGTTGYYLNTIFRDAISCGKLVKTKTKLSKTPVSIGTLTANAVFSFQLDDNNENTLKNMVSNENTTDKKLFAKEYEEKKVLIIGLSGKMGTIIMKNLYNQKGIHITGTIRRHNLPAEVMFIYPQVNMIDYKDRYDKIKEADIIISATSSPHYTVTYHELKNYIKDNKKRLFIDLAVPKDIDKDITKLAGVELIDIDYFKKLSEKNNQIKLKEVEIAELIIEEQVEELLKEITFRNFLPSMSEVKHIFSENSLESILYQLKNNISSSELKVILESLKTLLK